MTAESTKLGIIGCGNISGIYLKNCIGTFSNVRVAACADLDAERARARAAEHGLKAMTVDELLADPEIRIVINLTVPGAHAEVALAALEAGKSVYNEKPLATTREDAKRMLEIASANGLRVGGAPDTFLGAGLQTCRRLIDEGAIGEPLGATAFMMGRGPEGWHPNPAFFYQFGGGPMFDMGPYYLTALVSLLGPVARVTGSARISFPERTIGSGPNAGRKLKVDIPTHIVGVLDFAAGPVANVIMSFDVWAAQMPRIEIYGSEGSLSVPDPNSFGGPVKIWRAPSGAWDEVPVTRPYAANSRGLGVADMANAIRSGRPHRASGELAYHVLDLMHSVHDASRDGRHVEMASTCERPEPLPEGLVEGDVPR